jgi:hypothetical protein
MGKNVINMILRKFPILTILIIAIALGGIVPVSHAENSLNQTNSSGPYYVTIDPIGNVTSGDVFIIHGTTNVPSTEILRGFIIPYYFMTGGRINKPFAYLGNISIISTSSGTNEWSVNVTDHWGDLPIDWSPYQAGIDYNGDIIALQDFTVLPPPNATPASIPATTSLTHPQVQTSLTPSSTPTQSSPVSLVLPSTAIATLMVVRSMFGKNGD